MLTSAAPPGRAVVRWRTRNARNPGSGLQPMSELGDAMERGAPPAWSGMAALRRRAHGERSHQRRTRPRPNAVYHCQSDETPSTTFGIAQRGLRKAETTAVTGARSDAICSPLIGGVKRQIGRRVEVRERSHRAARVRTHSRPHSAMRGGRVPLAADVIARLEDRHVEADLQRMLGGDETARAGTDDRQTCTGSQPHTATLPDRATLGSRAFSQPRYARRSAATTGWPPARR